MNVEVTKVLDYCPTNEILGSWEIAIIEYL